MFSKTEKELAGAYTVWKIREGVNELKKSNDIAERSRVEAEERDRELCLQQEQIAREQQELAERDLALRTRLHQVEMEQQKRNADEVQAELAELKILLLLTPEERVERLRKQEREKAELIRLQEEEHLRKIQEKDQKIQECTALLETLADGGVIAKTEIGDILRRNNYLFDADPKSKQSHVFAIGERSISLKRLLNRTEEEVQLLINEHRQYLKKEQLRFEKEQQKLSFRINQNKIKVLNFNTKILVRRRIRNCTGIAMCMVILYCFTYTGWIINLTVFVGSAFVYVFLNSLVISGEEELENAQDELKLAQNPPVITPPRR